MSEKIETWKVLCYTVNDYREKAAKELDAIIAAAEERGRRSGVEETEREWRSAFDSAWHGGCLLWACQCDEPKDEGNCVRFRNLLNPVALAPRDSTTADDGYCKTCNSINGTHQSWCTSFKALRDSGKGEYFDCALPEGSDTEHPDRDG